jgi:glycosyltransferase involved in cell wall biosynthesis
MQPLVVGYLLDRYPSPTQTFVSNEIDELRRQGVHISVVAVEEGQSNEETPPPLIALRAASPTRSEVLGAHARWMRRSPVRYARFLGAVRTVRTEVHGGRTDPHVRTVPWRLLPYAASRLEAEGVRQLHAHFAWTGAAAAMCLAELTGWPWSMTVHANDIFSKQVNLAPKLEDADLVITVCDYNARWMRSELGFTRELPVIVCGVEIPDEPTAVKTIDVVSVGRLVSKKGFDTLIEAVALMDNPQLKVVIAGSGKLEAALRDQIAAAGLESVVTLAGELSHDATLELIDRAKVFALAARVAADGDRDSMPVVIKEAMAHGVPVIATDAVGIPEMVDDSFGELVAPDDAAALAAALEAELNTTFGEYRARSRAARAAAERFELSLWVSRLRTLLEDLSA